MNIPNFASRCQSNGSMLLGARTEPSRMAKAAAPILARNILLLCHIFGSLKRQSIDLLQLVLRESYQNQPFS
jgi:hypothetical protein